MNTTILLPNEGDEQDVAEVGFGQNADLLEDDGFRSEFPDYDYDPFAEPFVPSAPIASPETATVDRVQIEPDERDSHWSWHDAALVGVERTLAAGDIQYEVGCVDLYANTQTGDLGGNYLRLDSFSDVDAAAGYYHQMQQTIHDQHIAPFYVADFAARESAGIAEERRQASPA